MKFQKCNVSLVTLVCFGFGASAATADLVFIAAGVSPKGIPVEYRATFSIVGDQLTITVKNDSSSPALNPDDLLGSMYFDLVNDQGVRPTLLNYTAWGDIYLADKDGPDLLQQVQFDLVADSPGDGTWQFKAFSPSSVPYTGFGLGTVGNSSLSPNNFNGNIVGAINYSIYAGEITTSNLDGRMLVKDQITFTFSGVQGFSENQIGNVIFGLGTAPDSLLHGFAIPEPSSALSLCMGLVWMLLHKRRRRA